MISVFWGLKSQSAKNLEIWKEYSSIHEKIALLAFYKEY